MKTPLARSTNCRPAAAAGGSRAASAAVNAPRPLRYTTGLLAGHTHSADTCAAAAAHCKDHRKPAAEHVPLLQCMTTPASEIRRRRLRLLAMQLWWVRK
ncbi:hypothetical protein MTO96_011812 [Rhipicephalus appendiculatus]